MRGYCGDDVSGVRAEERHSVREVWQVLRGQGKADGGVCFFFSSRRRHTRFDCDWSSDVCSSDLRTPEFSALGLLVEQAKGGQGHIALIAGEAGIGKSRLVSELKALAVVEGFLVVQGACFPTDLTYPYAPLLDLLRSLVASNPKASLTAAVETLARDIFPLLPELVPDQTTSLPRLEPEQEKHRLFAVLATFFLYLSTQSPVLLIIEDAHWSDDTSLDFLHYLTRRSASQPLLLLVTYRHEEMQPELSSWLAQLDRERLAHEIRLGPLARSEEGRVGKKG